MKLSSDMLEEFRREIDDVPAEDGSTDACLWSDIDLYRYMNEAASHVARRLKSYERILTLDVTATEAMIKLPEQRLLHVRRAYLSTAGRELLQANMNQDILRNDYGVLSRRPDFEVTTGTPTQFYLDYQPGYLRLYPIPTAVDTLTLHAVMVPPTIYAGAPLPFTDEEDLHLLRLYMLYRAYNKHDSDTFNPTKAREAERAFDEYARLRNVDYRRQMRSPGTVRMQW
jgi:hypothetical protein